MLAARLERGVNDVQRSEYVVCYRLDHVLFHQRDMLMCSYVKDGVRLVAAKNRGYPPAVTNVRNHRHEGDIWEVAPQLMKDVENRILAVTEEDNTCWRKPGNLTAKLASNRTTSPGHNHRLTRCELRDR